ncbi:SRPBCC domain-containing protein [Candidatus Planktophila sulfonica]|uniref:SRPBCC domain-containing protein n=1 Tax=Candidatus Planktophila sulfonica TaxID=1884904 RepID=A0A249KFL4_9ACTN|nr:SRPBCC domain-containing protein [Candidatus Planktophila sulfonica]ASY15590.1 SRPBCC domain-containing protein [Candidatus Planktophila sulfonica]
MTHAFLYSVEREYPVSIDRLWKAWTDASELESWYFPTDLGSTKGATVSDLTIGGLWTCGVEVPEQGFTAYFFGKYSAIEKSILIEHTLHYTTSPEEFAAKDFTTESHLIRIEFENRGSNSWSKFSQFGELPDGQAEMAQAGMNSYLESLALFLAR